MRGYTTVVPGVGFTTVARGRGARRGRGGAGGSGG